MKKTICEKIRFAENLAQHVVTIKDNKVIVHCIGWHDLIVTPQEGESIEILRHTIHELIKGTPAGINDVQTLLSIAL